jgi:hypothetical protein
MTMKWSILHKLWWTSKWSVKEYGKRVILAIRFALDEDLHENHTQSDHEH